MKNFMLVLLMLFGFESYAIVYTVNDEDSFDDAIDDAIPGDTIEMIAGIWLDSDLLIDVNGTESSPIVIKAQTPGLTTLMGHTRFRISGDYIVVSGLIFENCTSINSNLIDFRRTVGEEANHSRLTDCVVKNCNPPTTTEDYKWVGIRGTHNEVDHCYFENKSHVGAMLVVWSSTMPGYHSIHHNYFGPSPEGDGNGWETIRVGTSSFAQNDGFNTVEHNYFYQRDGEIEIISGKSSNCTYQYNIFEECKGGLTLRHGTNCLVEGNMFFGNNKSGTYGIRVVDRDHTVINNYMQELNHGSSSYRHPLTLMGGEVNPAANGYQHNINNILAYNTIINCTRGIMIDPDSDHPVSPDNFIIANNIVQISDFAPVSHISTPTNETFIGNYFYRVDGDVLVPATGYVDVDPELFIATGDSIYRPTSSSPVVDDAITGQSIEIQDFEGHMRSNTPTVGCDEISTSASIDRGIYGPLWMFDEDIGGDVGIVSILLEAEDANVGSNWSIEIDALACGSEYANPPNGNSTGSPPESVDDMVNFSFSLNAGGTYKIFARTLTTDGSDDSFWVRDNEGEWVRWNTINGPNYPSGYHWEQVGEWDGNSDTADPVSFNLTSGENTVDFAWREDEARLDKIFITNEDIDVLNLVQNNTLNDEFSLRYTIENACPLDTIYFADSTNNVLFPFDENTLEISMPLTLIGNGGVNTILDGDEQYQMFINNSTGFTLSDIKLRNGYSIINGGSINNNGTLILNNVSFENNLEGTTPKVLTNNGTISVYSNGIVNIKE